MKSSLHCLPCKLRQLKLAPIVLWHMFHNAPDRDTFGRRCLHPLRGAMCPLPPRSADATTACPPSHPPLGCHHAHVRCTCHSTCTPRALCSESMASRLLTRTALARAYRCAVSQLPLLDACQRQACSDCPALSGISICRRATWAPVLLDLLTHASCLHARRWIITNKHAGSCGSPPQQQPTTLAGRSRPSRRTCCIPRGAPGAGICARPVAKI